ncbi:L-allo-threonine aldolase [Andreprevotia sp. IGB-42]|uniref:threonine aldolase family protein n=1 Tax=Andreprevotia sp. IGB-42 TaxID=2497473 RepID=UPI0013583070|nr:GntG family PLP-dependent aldolase [Andreprevotia sp. IGB-42]KAF0812481.1 L-allo-threonine aldolase [Andreprevotia sp. IGB-42]
MNWIDIRSDTVTQPTPAMRSAMANAEVGDDVYGDDPTVPALEARAAELVGKDAALFVPTGTFGNQLALFTHCQHGDEVILGEETHIVWHEVGAAAVIAGVNLRPVPTLLGELAPADITRRVRPAGDIHLPRTGLVCLENAHSNGRALPLANMQACHAAAKAAGLPIHLDGARVFNAATALGVAASEIAACADTVMFCLSKGLAAPIGSILAGPADFIDAARKRRKLLGGGWRQAGMLAAAGLIALDDMRLRLADDHAHARQLAALLDGLPGITVRHDQLDINMVWFDVASHIDVPRLMAALQTAGIKANPPEDGVMRLVTHWQIDAAAVEKIAATIATSLR